MQHPTPTHEFADLHIDYAMPRMDGRDAPNLPQVQTGIVQSLRLAVLSVWHRWQELRNYAASVEEFYRDALHTITETQRGGAEVGLPIHCREDLSAGNRTVIHHLEGADALGLRDRGFFLEDELRALHTLGIRCITPVYSNGNQFGGGSNQLSDGMHRLSSQGMVLVDAALKFGIAVDTAHMNVETRDDVLNLTEGTAPVAYTHGGLDIFTRFSDGRLQERGIPIRQVDRLRESGGIIGISVTRPFVTSTEDFDTTLDVLLDSPLRSRGVAIGTDFGGVSPDDLLPGLTNHHEVLRYLIGRVERGEIAEEHLPPILCGNALDFFSRTLKTRKDLAAQGLV